MKSTIGRKRRRLSVLKPLREALGWDIPTMAKFLDVPLKAAENWDEARYKPPECYVKLMMYRIRFGEIDG